MAGMSASDQGVGGDATGECIPRHCVVTGALGGIGAAVVALVGIKVLNGRKRKKELKELQKLLSRD